MRLHTGNVNEGSRRRPDSRFLRVHTLARGVDTAGNIMPITRHLVVTLLACTAFDLAPARAETAPTAPTVPTSTVRYRRRPGPRFMMPLKIDLGASTASTERGFAPGVAGAIGIHWASLSPRPTKFDVGLGVFGGFHIAEQMSTTDDSNTLAYGGAYLEGARVLTANNWGRTWASARGEYLSSSAFGGDSAKGVGVSGRLSAELFASGVGIEPRGLFLGTYAMGVYVEAGARQMAEGINAFQATVGLTFRTPLVFAP
jgi:hypothetical protein